MTPLTTTHEPPSTLETEDNFSNFMQDTQLDNIKLHIPSHIHFSPMWTRDTKSVSSCQTCKDKILNPARNGAAQENGHDRPHAFLC